MHFWYTMMWKTTYYFLSCVWINVFDSCHGKLFSWMWDTSKKSYCLSSAINGIIDYGKWWNLNAIKTIFFRLLEQNILGVNIKMFSRYSSKDIVSSFFVSITSMYNKRVIFILYEAYVSCHRWLWSRKMYFLSQNCFYVWFLILTRS